MTIWHFWISDCKYVLLLIQVFAIDCFACNASCMSVCERNRVTSQRSIQPVRNSLNRGLCTANTYEHHHCVTTLFSFRAWTDKTNSKAEAHDYVRGIKFPTRACGVRPITMHWVSWPIRADCTCWKEWRWNGEVKRRIWERRGIEELHVV